MSLSKETVREVLLTEGMALKKGQDDLPAPTYAAVKAVLTRAGGKANETLTADNWGPVMHTAFRHAGTSKAAAQIHALIDSMDNAEWLDIVDYMLTGFRRENEALGAKL